MVESLDFRPMKVCWKTVAREVNSRASRVYVTGYIKDVAYGYKTNKQLHRLLDTLGVLSFLRKVRQEAV